MSRGRGAGRTAGCARAPTAAAGAGGKFVAPVQAYMAPVHISGGAPRRPPQLASQGPPYMIVCTRLQRTSESRLAIASCASGVVSKHTQRSDALCLY